MSVNVDQIIVKWHTRCGLLPRRATGDGLMTIHNKRNKEIQHTQHMKHVVIVTDARINLPYTRPPILNNAP